MWLGCSLFGSASLWRLAWTSAALDGDIFTLKVANSAVVTGRLGAVAAQLAT